VEDTHSVVIGGLIDESMTRTEYKTPCLGDIPGLGWAFKNLSEGEERTNLYVFLTPRVVKNPLEAAHILKEKKESVTRDFNSGAVPLYKKINEIGKKLSGQPESSESP
jgi:general secretion pathway protein D